MGGSIQWIGTCLRSTARVELEFIIYFLFSSYYVHLVILFYPFAQLLVSTIGIRSVQNVLEAGSP